MSYNLGIPVVHGGEDVKKPDYNLPILDLWRGKSDEDVSFLGHEETSAIRELLIGKTVIKVNNNHLVLSDGTILRLEGNIGGCSCSAGDYHLIELNDCPVNAIMNVEFDQVNICDEYGDGPTTYRIFVLAQDRRIKLAEFEGDDGNGYYGTGYWITVKKPDSTS